MISGVLSKTGRGLDLDGRYEEVGVDGRNKLEEEIRES